MISKVKFEKMQFKSFGFVELPTEKVTYRLPNGYNLNARPTAELRGMISNTVHDVKEKTGKTMEKLIVEDCNISMATYKQYISGKNRQPSRAFILKLCVGLNLSVEKSNELLSAHSGELNLTNDVDAITYYALLDGDSIYDYESELHEKCGIDYKI